MCLTCGLTNGVSVTAKAMFASCGIVDDIVVGFEKRDDAEQFQEALAAAVCQVWPGTAPRENPLDRVRSLRKGASAQARSG